jgi:tellurite resistance protein TerC
MHFVLLLSTFDLLRLGTCLASPVSLSVDELEQKQASLKTADAVETKVDFEDTAIRPASNLSASLATHADDSSARHSGAKMYGDYEAEAAAIDAELALSERLIVNAWDILRRAPLPGVAYNARPQLSVGERWRELVESVSAVEWYFFLVAIAVMISVDTAILQHLPEIERTHIGLMIFWLLVAASFCAEVWLRLGEEAGISWASGYLLELVYSMELLFVFNFIFQCLETPRRLMRKALFVSVVGAIVLKLAFYLGLAEAMYGVAIVPYVLGAFLIYCGTQQLARSGPTDEEMRDVTQTPVVRLLRTLLGKRLAEFYDEEGEAIFIYASQKFRMNLLGVVVFSLLLAVFFFSSDASLVKLNVIPNAYVSFSSSVLALLTLRALVFVVRDILTHFSFARYGTGLIFFFVGAEWVISRFTEVSAMMSLIVVVNVMMFMAILAALKDSTCPKRVT